MVDKLLEMPFLRNVGVILTYRCQAACPHCILEAGPNRTEELNLSDASYWIRQIAGYRNGHIKVLSLTGGEPFIDLDRLRIVSDLGALSGLTVSSVTNAFWASDRESALETLRKIPALRMLAISCDAYHQKSIPFDNVNHAISAARTLGLPYNVAVCTQKMDDHEYLALMSRLYEITDIDTINTAIAFPAGRAVRQLDPSYYRMSQEPPIAACSAGSSPIILPDGRVIACIGPIIDLKNSHPLLLGNLNDETINSILDRAEANPVLHAIRVWGPRKLIAMINDSCLKSRLPEAYIENSVCNACYALMADPEIVSFLTGLEKEASFVDKVLYARAFYMQEVSPNLDSLLRSRPIKNTQPPIRPGGSKKGA